MTGRIQKRPMTIDEVLDVLRRDHELLVACDEAEDVDVDLNTTVHDWLWLGDDLSYFRVWVSNAKRLNRIFEIDATLDEWKCVLTPARVRLVRDICQFVASRAVIIDVSPARVLGRDCRTAGAFLTVKHMLRDAGVDTSDLAPSTPLADYAASGLPKIYLTLLRMAPQLIQRARPTYRSETLLLTLGAVLFFATPVIGGIALDKDIRFLPVALAALVGFIFVWRRSERQLERPARVTLEALGDFKDLSRALADEPVGANPKLSPSN